MGKVKDELIRELETPPTCCGCGVDTDGGDCGECQRAEAEAAKENFVWRCFVCMRDDFKSEETLRAHQRRRCGRDR